MQRKLVKQGPATLTVSVPAEWVKGNGLKAGDDVTIVQRGPDLLVSSNQHEETPRTITIDMRPLNEPLIGIVLASVHKKGYEEVRLQIGPNQLEIVENRVRKGLLGFEIVQHSGNTIVIRFVTRVDKEELPVLIRRAFLVTLSIAEGAATSHTDLRDLLVLEETNNRLTNYCERMLVHNTKADENAVFSYIIVWLLEKMADEYRDTIRANIIKNADAKICFALIKQFYELYYKYSFERHDAFLRELDETTARFRTQESALLSVLGTMKQASGSLVAMNLQ